jgi:hypothetical protein
LYWSLEGTERATTSPSAVMIDPRGLEKSRSTSRLLAGLSLSSSAWKIVRRLTWKNSAA